MQNDASKLYATAVTEEHGGSEASITRAVDLYQQLARDGHAEALIRLGLLLEEDRCPGRVDSLYATAAHCFKLAAGLGHPRGLYNVGRLAYQSEDYKCALESFTLAVELGDAPSLIYIGLCYESGHMVEKDANIAFSYYHAAASLGQTDGVLRLLILTRREQLSPAQAKTAGELLLRYSERADPRILYECGIAALSDKNGLSNGVAFASAAYYMKQAADLQHVDAQVWIGEAYLSGKHVPKSCSDAIRYLKMASDAGDLRAIRLMGTMFLRGLGVPVNREIARDYFEKGARRGCPKCGRILDLWEEFVG